MGSQSHPITLRKSLVSKAEAEGPEPAHPNLTPAQPAHTHATRHLRKRNRKPPTPRGRPADRTPIGDPSPGLGNRPQGRHHSRERRQERPLPGELLRRVQPPHPTTVYPGRRQRHQGPKSMGQRPTSPQPNQIHLRSLISGRREKHPPPGALKSPSAPGQHHHRPTQHPQPEVGPHLRPDPTRHLHSGHLMISGQQNAILGSQNQPSPLRITLHRTTERLE
jgi:hypothetical protein